jgi:hypothetical protein
MRTPTKTSLLVAAAIQLAIATGPLLSNCPGDRIGTNGACPNFTPTSACSNDECNPRYYAFTPNTIYTYNEEVGNCVNPFPVTYNVNYTKYVLQSGSGCLPVLGNCTFISYSLSVTCHSTGCTEWCAVE